MCTGVAADCKKLSHISYPADWPAVRCLTKSSPLNLFPSRWRSHRVCGRFSFFCIRSTTHLPLFILRAHGTNYIYLLHQHVRRYIKGVIQRRTHRLSSLVIDFSEFSLCNLCRNTTNIHSDWRCSWVRLMQHKNRNQFFNLPRILLLSFRETIKNNL